MGGSHAQQVSAWTLQCPCAKNVMYQISQVPIRRGIPKILFATFWYPASSALLPITAQETDRSLTLAQNTHLDPSLKLAWCHRGNFPDTEFHPFIHSPSFSFPFRPKFYNAYCFFNWPMDQMQNAVCLLAGLLLH